MSTAEETLNPPTATQRKQAPVLNRILDFVSSVRVGVIQLCMLVVLAMAGMLIMQQNVDGFDAYYASLTPAEKTVFAALGLFDIYYSWYFKLLLLTLSLNIVLASIDHFPSAWAYIVDPKLTATRDWLLGLRSNTIIERDEVSESDAAEKIKEIFKSNGLESTVTETEIMEYGIGADGRKDFSVVNRKKTIVVFGESGKTNRLGAYIVHVALLTLFLGHFVFLVTSFDADVRMIPGSKTDSIQLIKFDLDKRERFNVQLPFSMECTDIQQRLIDEKGGIDVSNTLDWRTELKIDDPQYGVSVEEASLNKPLFYRGYRFFQAQTIPIGHARTITLDLTPQNGGVPIKANIERNGSTTLPDGTKVDFTDFEPDFTFGPDGQPDTRSGDYNNPVAVLNVTPPDGEKIRVFAFAQKLADNIPVGAPKAGYKWRLAEFEKSPMAHVLAIKYDPYNASIIAWYVGGFGLIGALMFVFFFSHKRVWAQIAKEEDGKIEIVLAGDVNRNEIAFEDKFKSLADSVSKG
ncbi:MAG: cytochrome c biogenesis protein ResB [Chloracidobacterium sp.]|nr:cytochrome c biogenesis protein ResB [Chloracidobacterium sp.]